MNKEYDNTYFPINKCGKVKVKVLAPRPAGNPSRVYVQSEKDPRRNIQLPRPPMPRFGIYVEDERILTLSFWENIDACRRDVKIAMDDDRGSATILTFDKLKKWFEEVELAVDQAFSEIIDLYMNMEEYEKLPQTDALKLALKVKPGGQP